MLTLIAAVDPQNQIGASNGLPWVSPEDLRFFRQETIGGTIIMEFEQLRNFDPEVCFRGREVLIIDPLKRPRPANTLTFVDTKSALRYCRRQARSRVYVVGGPQLYEEMLPEAYRVLLSHSTAKSASVLQFPQLPQNDWESISGWMLECEVVPLVSEYIRRV